MDYQALCKELFGTDDVAELKKIARKAKDNRNAGRKRKFSEKQVTEMEKMLATGKTIDAVAERYGTARQVIDRYVNRPPQGDYTLRMTYMNGTNICTIIDVDFLNEKVAIKNRTEDVLHRAFGVVEEPTWEQFQEFLKDRCFPETRGDVKALLRDLDLDCYDPLQIVEKTRGRTADDPLWIRFKYYPKGRGLYANN